MVSMARDRIYFALQSYQDKTSFDDNTIWLLSQDIIFPISKECRPIPADLMKSWVCLCICMRAGVPAHVPSKWQPSANSKDAVMEMKDMSG